MTYVKYGVMILIISALLSCATLTRYIPQIQTTSSHDRILTTAKTFTIVQTDTSGYTDPQWAISQRNAESNSIDILLIKGLSYIDLHQRAGSPDIWVMISTKIGSNDYGYYFPGVEIVVFLMNPQDPEKSVPLWSGNAQMRIENRSVYQYFPQLLERLWNKFPN